MTMEIANKLVELRKKNGLSQEQLAEKIGVSRQAVSKWERNEASPDIDNLILLARLYKISLDDLLLSERENPLPEDKAIEHDSSEKQENFSPGEENKADGNFEENRVHTNDETDTNKYRVNLKKGIDVHDGKDHVHVGFDGINVEDGEDSVHVGFDGIYVNDAGRNNHVDVSPDGVYVNGKKYDDGVYINGKKYDKSDFKYDIFRDFPCVCCAIIAFLGCGVFLHGWAWSWLWILAIPLYHGVLSAVRHRNAHHFPYAVAALLVFFLLGFFANAWHPGWLIFLTIPLYHWIATCINKSV